MRLIRFRDCPAVPWKNGGGTTRELWRLDAADGVQARISAASISGSQAFSRFEGFDRLILQLEGPPVTLTIAGRDIEMLPGAPLAFRGEAEVSSRVEGVALDLNLMALRRSFRPTMRVERLRVVSASAPEALCAVLALEDVALGDGPALQAHDMVLLEKGERVALQQAARVVVMELHPTAAQ